VEVEEEAPEQAVEGEAMLARRGVAGRTRARAAGVDRRAPEGQGERIDLIARGGEIVHDAVR